jgi:hypothetical protein
MQRSNCLSPGDDFIGVIGCSEGVARHHIDHGIDARVDLFEPGKAARYRLAARDLTLADGFCEVVRPPSPEFGVHRNRT